MEIYYCKQCGKQLYVSYYAGGVPDLCGKCDDERIEKKEQKRKDDIASFIKKGYKPSDLKAIGFKKWEIKEYYNL